MTESQPELNLWKQVYAVGIEGLEKVSEYEWNFSNLDAAFEEGGVLHGNRVYLFSASETQFLFFNGQRKVNVIPTVVAVVSPSPPSDKIAVFSGIREDYEEISNTQLMNMDWVPYTPKGQRGPSFERLEPEIFILNGVQRRADLKDCYCVPYLYNPLEEEDEEGQVITIIYPFEAERCTYVFDLEEYDDEVEEIINEIITMKKLSGYEKDNFKKFMWTKFQEERKAYREARENRLRAREPELAAIKKMRFYKFYPVATAATPNISQSKRRFINRYYGSAHQVF